MNLQDISAVTSNDLDLSRESRSHSILGHFSSIRFTNSIIGNLGAPLRDGPLEHDDDDEADVNVERIKMSNSATPDELHVGSSSFVADVVEEIVAGTSGISTGP